MTTDQSFGKSREPVFNCVVIYIELALKPSINDFKRSNTDLSLEIQWCEVVIGQSRSEKLSLVQVL